jgi:hypothetical protein
MQDAGYTQFQDTGKNIIETNETSAEECPGRHALNQHNE